MFANVAGGGMYICIYFVSSVVFVDFLIKSSFKKTELFCINSRLFLSSFPQDDLGVFQRLSTMSSIQSPSFMGRSHRLTSGIQGSDLAASDIVVLRGGFNTSSPPNQGERMLK